MFCPVCKKIKLEKEIFHNVEVDYCPVCLGIWFDEDELRWAKDDKDKTLNWMDVDLWNNSDNFKIGPGKRRICPSCRVPLYEVYYGDSGIIVDICNVCRGVWLDRQEFSKIVQWLRKRADYKIMNNYSKSLLEELGEVFMGPESFKEEIADFMTILKLLNYCLIVRFPVIAKLISIMPK